MRHRLFSSLAKWSIAHPWRTITVLTVAVLAAGPGLFCLDLRTDGHALVPPEDPAVLCDQEVREHFGLRDPIVVCLETSHPDGIYNQETLGRVLGLTEALAALPDIGPEQVMSLASERRDRVYPGTMRFRPFLDPLPDTPELLAQVRDDVAAAEILTGTLVSDDGRATAILVGVPNPAASGPGDYYDRAALHDLMLATVEPWASPDDRIMVVGAPVAEVLLGRHIIADLSRLVPIAITVIALVLWLCSRRLWCVVLGLGEVGACLVWTFGLMGWLGIPVYLTTAVLPVILTTIGLADEIHIFWHYQRLLAAQPDLAQTQVVGATFGEMTRPVVLTSLTTTLGFLSFLSSPIAAVRSFGVFAGVGIIFCMLWSLTVIPAALVLIPRSRIARSAAGTGGTLGFAGMAAVLRGHRRPVLALLMLASLGLGWASSRLYVQDSWIDGFARSSQLRRDTDRVNQLFHGSHLLLAHLTFSGPAEFENKRLARGTQSLIGPLLDPALVHAVGDFEAFLRDRPEVGGVLGPHSHLRTVRYLWLARRQGARLLPDDPLQIQRILTKFDQARGQRRRREVIDDELRRAVVTIFLKDANYRETASLIAAIRSYQQQHLAEREVQVTFAGDVAVSQAMIPAIVNTQIISLLLALGGGFLAVWLLAGSLTAGIFAIAPTALAVLWVFGVMGGLGVPLGVATSMFCAITLGIGVDYGIHFYERYRRARVAGAPDPVAKAIVEAGPAIVADSLAVLLGFGLLTFSQVPANARLGLLVAVALLASCLLTLVGLGTLLAAKNNPVAEN